jgi:hypothetical protein
LSGIALSKVTNFSSFCAMAPRKSTRPGSIAAPPRPGPHLIRQFCGRCEQIYADEAVLLTDIDASCAA